MSQLAANRWGLNKANIPEAPALLLRGLSLSTSTHRIFLGRRNSGSTAVLCARWQLTTQSPFPDLSPPFPHSGEVEVRPSFRIIKQRTEKALYVEFGEEASVRIMESSELEIILKVI